MGTVTTRGTRVRSWKNAVRRRDLAWIALFAALAWGGPASGPVELSLLGCLGALQLVEQRIPALATPRGNLVSIAIKLLLTYLLIGYTGGLNSSYYPLLILPVVSAATTLGAAGSIVFTALACAAYLSFLLLLDWT